MSAFNYKLKFKHFNHSALSNALILSCRTYPKDACPSLRWNATAFFDAKHISSYSALLMTLYSSTGVLDMQSISA